MTKRAFGWFPNVLDMSCSVMFGRYVLEGWPGFSAHFSYEVRDSNSSMSSMAFRMVELL